MSKKRLLIIEDDADVAEMLVVYFTAQGYDVLNAMSGNEGVAMARAKFPNMILLDIMLPDMDGFDVAKMLRTTTLTKYIPITFLTQRDARADKVAGLELGADDYITKPFDVEELRLRIQGALRRSSRETLQDPRTGLPTNALIEEVRQALGGRPGFTQLNAELIGFKAFRDKYGFVAADEALSFVGQVLSESIAKDGTPDDFVGVNSEDRYTIFTFAPDLNAFVQALGTRFDEGARKYYTFMDSEQGFIVINENTDEEQHIPLMHFAITSVEERVSSNE